MTEAVKQIFVSGNFEAFHKWKDAPEEVAFLRNLHRHLFGFKITMGVTHNDRDKEFFIVKREIMKFINRVMTNQEVGSCEQICEVLNSKFGEQLCITKIEVDEDGENGACYVYPERMGKLIDLTEDVVEEMTPPLMARQYVDPVEMFKIHPEDVVYGVKRIEVPIIDGIELFGNIEDEIRHCGKCNESKLIPIALAVHTNPENAMFTNNMMTIRTEPENVGISQEMAKNIVKILREENEAQQ